MNYMNKIINILVAGALIGAIFSVPSALAAATVTPGNGGTNLAQGSGFVNLTNILISEGIAGDISVGTHTFTLPAGWEFDTASNINITTTSSVMTIVPTSVTPGVNSFSFQIQSPSLAASDLVIQSVRVRPTGTSSGNITHSGASIAGVTGGTSFASLSVAGGGGGGNPAPSNNTGSSGGASGGGAPLVPPSNVFIKINGGDETTDNREVKLRLTADYAGDMIIVNDEPNFEFGKLESYAEFKDWTLSEGSGEKTIYVKFRSPVGLYTDPISATITLTEEVEEVSTSSSSETTVENNFNKADVNTDSYVDVIDANLLIPNWGQGGNPFDITGDGRIDISDFNEVITNWSSVSNSNVRTSNVRDGRIILTPISISTDNGSLISVQASVEPGSSTVYTTRLVLDYPTDLLTLNSVNYNSGWIPLSIGNDNLNSSSVVIRTAGLPGGINSTRPFATITFLADGIGEGNISLNTGSVLMNENNHDVFSDNGAQVAVRVQNPVATSATIDSVDNNSEVDALEDNAETEDNSNENLTASAFNFLEGVSAWIYLLILIILAGGAYGARTWQKSRENNTFDF